MLDYWLDIFVDDSDHGGQLELLDLFVGSGGLLLGLHFV